MKIDKCLSEADKIKIRDAVKEAEIKTSGEIVPAIVAWSDIYGGARWEIAFIFSIILTAFFWLFKNNLPFLVYLCSEIGLLFFGFLLAKIPCILRAFIHKRVLETEVHQRALEIFMEHNLHNTRENNGILIFISLNERRVEIIADSGIHAKVPQDFWNSIVGRMTSAIKSGDVIGAFLDSIARCGEVLANHFPKKPDGKNQIRDDLIVE